MIRIWISLDLEPPRTEVVVGKRASFFSCLWNPVASRWPRELLGEIPDLEVVEQAGVSQLSSGLSEGFSVTYRGSASDDALRTGLAVEDRYLLHFVRNPPEFEGVVEEIRYLWSLSWMPDAPIEKVTATHDPDSDGQLFLTAMAVLAAVE